MLALLFLNFRVIVDVEDDARSMAINVEYMIVLYRFNVFIPFNSMEMYNGTSSSQ